MKYMGPLFIEAPTRPNIFDWIWRQKHPTL